MMLLLTSLLLATGAHAAAFGKKELVDTAHPVLKKAFAEHGRLTKADFAALHILDEGV